MHHIEITETRRVEVTHLKAECGVRYWEDATVDGIEDTEGTLIPCRDKDAWVPVIDLATGRIKDWPEGKTARLHYKVCDDGRYALLDASGAEVAWITGYVPKLMCPGGSGYGDYVIMNIDASGQIRDWNADLSPFSDAD